MPNLFLLLPRFLAARGYDEQQIGLVMGGFNIASLVSMPLAGRLADRFGHRLVLMLGCLIAAAGAGWFYGADHLVSFTFGRALQGLGFGAVLVAAAAYVADIAPPGRLAQALGISGVLTLTSQAVGPWLGEVLHAELGWTAVFTAGALGGIGGALVAAPLPLASGRRSGGSFVSRGAGPIWLATGLAGMGFGSVWTFIADYTERTGVGAITPFFIPYTVAAIASRLALGHLADRLGRRATAVPALLGHAAALVLMATLSSRTQLIVVGTAFGFSHGLYYPALQAMIVERTVGARSRAIATSTFAFGFGILSAAFGLGAIAKYFAYPTIYWLAAGAGIVAAGAVFIAGPPARQRREH